MHPELTWPIGKSLVEVAKKAHTWVFLFSGGGTVATESVWRLVSKDRIIAASEDHGHLFGLKEPVDSAARALALADGKKVLDLQIADLSSDLTLHFAEDFRLEFLNLSCGYESWRAQDGANEIICMGGGGITVFAEEKEANQPPEPTR